MKLTCKTTREHFEKYCTMRAKLGVSFLNSTHFGTKEQLTKLFKTDPTLSSIPAYRFDHYWECYNGLRPGTTQEECANLIKHSLIYQVIGAKPEFI